MQQYPPPNRPPQQGYIPPQPNYPPPPQGQGYAPPHVVPSAPVPQPYGAPPYHPQAGPRRVKRRSPQTFILVGLGAFGFGVLSLVAAFFVGMAVLYGSGDVMPGVSAAGVEVGGLSEAAAANKLTERWSTRGIVLRDGERRWEINPTELGLVIDSTATAQEAHDWGRSDGSIIGAVEALLFGVDVKPHMNVNLDQARARLEELRPTIELPAKNAGIQLVNGQAQVVPPVQGRALDIETTLTALQADASGELADGALDLNMVAVAPAVTDATPLLAEAQALLSSPMTIELYDPVQDEALPVTLQPSEWGGWLVATPSAESSLGLALSLDQNSLTGYLNTQSSQLGGGRFLNVEEGVQQVNQALAQKQLQIAVRVYHEPSAYTVQAGETLSSIGYDTGIPYPWIQAANPNVGALNPGDTIVLPSTDELLPLPIVRSKRIVVSIPNQEMWAYENGQLLWNWPVSTGIARSPTHPGVFQIQSHEENAYGAQWNLYMPHFMGVYHPGPNVEVMNGFHGFPTDANGGYLLWTSSLGRPATYGCILLSLENAEALYNWAQEGVVVEIQG